MDATKILANRYILLLRALNVSTEFNSHNEDPFKGNELMNREHLAWMCQTIVAQSGIWPDDKIARWLGFVQGILAAQGLIDVKVERNFSRPLFLHQYRQMEIDLPPTLVRDSINEA